MCKGKAVNDKWYKRAFISGSGLLKSLQRRIDLKTYLISVAITIQNERTGLLRQHEEEYL